MRRVWFTSLRAPSGARHRPLRRDVIRSDQIDDATAAAIAEVWQSADGQVRVKLHDKRAALVDLGRHLGMRAGHKSLDLTVEPPPCLIRTLLLEIGPT
jgi:hypothetical protein